MRQLFSNADERTLTVTVVAGALLHADICSRGLLDANRAPMSNVEADHRIAQAFELAKRFVLAAEKSVP